MISQSIISDQACFYMRYIVYSINFLTKLCIKLFLLHTSMQEYVE
jgi:hypothetical protein